MLELINRPVRSAGDIKDMLGIPVLGSVAWKPARGRVRGIRSLMGSRRLLRLN